MFGMFFFSLNEVAGVIPYSPCLLYTSEIMTLLHQLAVEQNKAILLSTHDIEQALVLSDKLWLLSKETGLQCLSLIHI